VKGVSNGQVRTTPSTRFFYFKKKRGAGEREIYRLHTIGWTYWGEVSPDGKAYSTGLRPSGVELKSTRGVVNIDKFFRFLDKIREKKIYIAITLSVCSHIGPDEVNILKTTPEDEKAWVEAINTLNKAAVIAQIYMSLPTIDERASFLRQEWARDLLMLKHPKAGVQLAKDPKGKPFDPMLYVKGDMTFKGRKVEKIEHINFFGRLVKTVPGKGSACRFATACDYIV